MVPDEQPPSFHCGFPKAKTAIARTFGEEHRRYTRLKNFEEGIQGYLFQGRFNSVVLTSGT